MNETPYPRLRDRAGTIVGKWAEGETYYVTDQDFGGWRIVCTAHGRVDRAMQAAAAHRMARHHFDYFHAKAARANA